MFLRIINMRLYDCWDERHLVLVTRRQLAERAYLVNDQISPVTRNNYVEMSFTTCEMSFTTWYHHLVIEKKENI